MKLSIIKLIIMSSMAFVLLSSLPIYFAYKDLLQEIQLQTHRDYKNHLESVASRIGSYIEYLQRHTDNLAKNSDIIDIATFWDDNEIQSWAVKTRVLLPNTIGLAIFHSKSGILGDPDTLKIGPQCIDDAKNRAFKTSFDYPVAHQRENQLRHFDLYGDIVTDNGYQYVLLHTFQLKVIEDILYESLNNESYYLISDQSDQEIIKFSTPGSGEKFNISIPGTSWNLISTTTFNQKSSIAQFFITSAKSVIITMIVILILIITITYFLLNHDSLSLHQLLANIGKRNLQNVQANNLYLQDYLTIRKGILQQHELLLAARDKIEKMALEDQLTTLGNRHRFELDEKSHLSRAKRQDHIWIIVLDIDDFKFVNDNFGHAQGDQILFELGMALKQEIRGSDSIYRFGGDEFIAILYATENTGIESWYKRLSEQLQQKCEENKIISELNIRISAGASRVHQEDKSLIDAIQRADKALYHSKEQGKGVISINA